MWFHLEKMGHSCSLLQKDRLIVKFIKNKKIWHCSSLWWQIQTWQGKPILLFRIIFYWSSFSYLPESPLLLFSMRLDKVPIYLCIYLPLKFYNKGFCKMFLTQAKGLIFGNMSPKFGILCFKEALVLSIYP